MRRILIAMTLCLAMSFVHAQSTDSTLDVVCWNIEWFGASSNGPTNKALQEANVAKVLKWLNADLYGLVEIVDTMRFRRVVDSLGRNEFDYIISPYCTQATQPSGNAWLTGQKLAFIYRKSVFSNVSTRGMMRNSATANSNWASGRFPFMLSARVTMNGISKDMQFIVIHGKAGSTEADHTKRLGGAMELKDTLDRYYSSASTLLIGDFNDALHTPIYTGASTSSYLSFVIDSIDADHYKSITMPLSVAGQSSMINYPNVIDNHVISNEVAPLYIPGTARVMTNVSTVIPNYATVNQTSDHYPVFSRYDLKGTVVTGIPTTSATALGIGVWPNPAKDIIHISFPRMEKEVLVEIYDLQGKMMSASRYRNIQTGIPIDVQLGGWTKGLYQIILQTRQYRSWERILIN